MSTVKLTLRPSLLLSTVLGGALSLVGCAGAEAEGPIGATGATGATAPVATDSGVAISSTADFHDALAPYGSWLSTSEYGLVWQPSPGVVGADFMPYATAGNWSSTDAGWYFTSDWSWGWAPFHYGEWAEDAMYGWVWIPGTEWAPAWVDWRLGGGYIGWAPIGPYRRPPHWCFVPTGRFTEPRVAAYVLPPERTRVAIEVARPVGTVGARGHYNMGPSVDVVGREGGRPVRTVHVEAQRSQDQRRAVQARQVARPPARRPFTEAHRAPPAPIRQAPRGRNNQRR